MYAHLQPLLFLCGVLHFTIAVTELLDVEVEHHCIQRCPLQNQTDGEHYEIDCGFECSINKCVEGCKLWKQALESACQTVCNGTVEPLSPKELYCVMGCNDAVTRYFSQIRAKIGIPAAPALVADSLTATSLRLEWKFPEAIQARLTYYVQWRYEEHAASWQYCRNQTRGDNDVIIVDHLQPYTKYRFRVALMLSPHSEPIIVSAPSVVISTLPAGVPASPPIIVRAVPIDCTHVSVSWEPGPFPHGPLLSYVLHITDSHGYSALKDIPAENNFYMYRDLTPARNYTVSISMTNGVGTGPASQISISTPAEPLAKEVQQPVLILSSDHVVIEQGTDMLEVPVVLYRTEEFIKGIAIHVSQRLLFVSDTSSKVHRISFTNFTNNSNSSTILALPNINFQPLELSVDWLNNQLYILGEVTRQWQAWQITRCDLNGRGLQVALAGLRFKPHHIEVDPYNGFLFWVTHGNSGAGLYRLDLADISNGIKHNVQPELILAEPNLGAFTVDHTNFRLLCSNEDQNTINSVSLNGKEVVNVRPKIITSKMQKVLSLATANKTFYWTDGNDVFYEEYHSSRESYYHNAYPDLADRPYSKVIVNLPSSQPTPVPINPPTSLQAIFGDQLVKITWKTPHLLGEQGKGAWQNWSYVVSIKDVTNNYIPVVHKNINITSCIIQNLEDDKDYIIKVAAHTNLGNGPWSSEFHGKTLKVSKNGKYPIILWSAANGLLKSDATGENIQTLIHKHVMKDYHITDITWYNNHVYFVTNNSQIFLHNLDTQKLNQLVNIDSVGSIAIDWIGKKLYWSNPKQQLILRGNFNGSQQEPLPILTLAKELNIDATQAYLYWSTGHAVECARLNGADRFIYHSAQLFSGKQVMGLTLDMNHNMVYWIIRGSEGSNLFRAPMAGYILPDTKLAPEYISSLQKPDMQGPLCYFNDRLLWLKDDKNAVMSDLMGKNMAYISGKELSGLTMIYVMDSSLHSFPNTSNKLVDSITVIPNPIEKNTIKAVGSWNSFDITWEPCHTVNYGTVFYEIKVDTLLKNSSVKITTSPYIKFWQPVTPFTKLHIAIRAYTYWGTSALVRAKIYSPPSTPSAPGNLRTYVSYDRHHNDTQEFHITFRWDAPLYSNGVIQGYKIRCWFVNHEIYIEMCKNTIAKSNDREYIFTNQQVDEVYHFQVQAFTEIGDGEVSQIISVNASNEVPIPKLLVASTDSIFIQDVDENKNYTLLNGINTPMEMAYILEENKLFWVNEMQELLMFNIVTSNRSKLIDLNGGVIRLTVDWLERSLYYTQTSHNESSIYKLNLNHVEKGNLRSLHIFRTDAVIGQIEVSPFTRKLYWTQMNSTGQYNLMQCDTDGSTIEPLFSIHDIKRRDINNTSNASCNCSMYSFVQQTFTIDHSNLKTSPLLIFIDFDTHNIISTDKHGCYCNVITYNNVIGNSSPIHLLKSDCGMLYWTHFSDGLVYSLRRNDNNTANVEQINAQNILIFGSHMQPYPPHKCLVPKYRESLEVSLLQRTSTTLTLIMPKIELDSECENISTPTTEYKIYYKMVEGNNKFVQYAQSGNEIVTFNETVILPGLQPFTKYIFFVAANNYYLNLLQENVTMGPGVVFQTSVGAPSKPENITATVLNPTLVEVHWSPPKQINGESVWYEIHWQTEGDVHGIRQKGEQIVPTPNLQRTKNNFHAQLYRLSPNETYSVWIRAYSQTNQVLTDSDMLKNASSDSDSIKIITFPEPQNITLVNRTADELQIQINVYRYAKQCIMQYAYLISDDWFNAENISLMNDTVTVKISNLKPKAQYKFRMVLAYQTNSEAYIWPSDSRFVFETLGDRPSPPGMPKIQHLKGDVYQVWWEAPRDNGAPIGLYLLEGLKLVSYRNRRSTNRPPWFDNAPSVEEQEDNWIPLYNGTDTFWIITGLQDQQRYAFRASAMNVYGWSNTSEESSEFDLNIAAQLAEKQDPINLMIITTIPVMICILLIICFFCCKWYCTKGKTKQTIVVPRGPDVELATLRELPRRWIHNTNILYTTNQLTPDEITLLPHIRRDQITLMKFLGSGAFGEVFEGKARNIKESETEVNVAIKTLRKGASDVEKCEFLQEAQLMSHFKHEHILQLLGVCLDNDPQFIIMELMQGGDLLTYLRSSRNPITSTPSLTLIELIKMCVDVAKGCRYLEEMHFVHRDLACRNCLVSSIEPEIRIVKIGDFGLTRDIYKNDYYRKEGEGLLPVRWMAPESLVDGVFTCQSDVWAFGVLLWEIMTLGQQPYPARNNLEVLHYVKSGGRLGKPIDCPEKLHELMLKCWNYEPERRPTFKFCLAILEDLHNQAIKNSSSSEHSGSYISTVPQSTLWKTASDEETDREKTPFLSTEHPLKIPTYLELIYDGSCTEDNDGYEIPRSSIRSNKSEGLKIKPLSDIKHDTSSDKIAINETSNFNSIKNQSVDIQDSLTESEKHCYVNQEPTLGGSI